MRSIEVIERNYKKYSIFFIFPRIILFFLYNTLQRYNDILYQTTYEQLTDNPYIGDFFFFIKQLTNFHYRIPRIFFRFSPNSKYDISRSVLSISARILRDVKYPQIFVRIDVRLSNLTTDFSQILTYTYVYI